MTKLLFGFTLLTLSTTAYAGDSAWLSCKSKNLVLNVFEHRSENPFNRETDLTMIYGGRILVGGLGDGANDNLVALLKGSETETASVAVSIDYIKNQVKLEGMLVLEGTKFDISQNLKCSRMEQL